MSRFSGHDLEGIKVGKKSDRHVTVSNTIASYLDAHIWNFKTNEKISFHKRIYQFGLPLLLSRETHSVSHKKVSQRKKSRTKSSHLHKV
jgi:hypothetical protein